jgi:hypothetical protein
MGDIYIYIERERESDVGACMWFMYEGMRSAIVLQVWSHSKLLVYEVCELLAYEVCDCAAGMRPL